MMRTYCKAYHVRDLRQFPGWSERAKEDEAHLADEAVVRPERRVQVRDFE